MGYVYGWSISCRRPVEDEEEWRNIEKYLIQRWYAKSAMILGTIDQYYVEATHNYQYHLWICSFWLKKCFLFEYEELFGRWNGLYLMCFVPFHVVCYGLQKVRDTYILPVQKGLLLQPSVQPLQPKVPLLEPLFGTGFPAPPRKSTN